MIGFAYLIVSNTALYSAGTGGLGLRRIRLSEYPKLTPVYLNISE